MIQKRRVAMGMMVGVLGALLVGCSSDQKTEKKVDASPAVMPVNKMCPIGDHAVASGKTETYKGKTIGFCCSDCKAKFDSMTEAQKDAAMTKAMASK